METNGGRYSSGSFSWSSVFAGIFVFLATEATFAVLAAAVFRPHTTGTLGVGPSIWMIILSIISLYFAGKAAGHFSGAVSKLNGMYHGLVTFGVSIFTSLFVAALVAGTTEAPAVPNLISANSAWLLVALILGGIAAGIDGSQGIPRTAQVSPAEQRGTLRPAA